MKVLVTGGGGREHALARKILESDQVSDVYVAPGNGGTEGVFQIGGLEKRMENAKDDDGKPIQADETEKLIKFAYRRADLVVVGPEGPLVDGFVDVASSQGLYVSGCSQAAARLEGSKVFAKNLMREYGIPTARFKVATDTAEAQEHVKCFLKKGKGVVLKADGLALGKGVIVCDDYEDAMKALDRIMIKKEFGQAGDSVIIEERLHGEEASFIALTDGKTVFPLASSQDHKRAYDRDKGPNTGGMGAYSPAPVITDSMYGMIMDEIMTKTVVAMRAEGKTFKGVLYAGIMVVEGKPYVLEFNARMGDPETQPILMRMKSDIVPYLKACIDGNLAEMPPIEWHDEPAVCVVIASGGYPGSVEKGKEIHGLNKIKGDNVFVYHAGTAIQEGKIVTAGGRVLGVTARGPGIEAAIREAYAAADKISFGSGFGHEKGGYFFRRDIGAGAIGRK